ncbi:plasmid maintenance protein, partial [Borrelia persica]|uniref:plasmid maintenance protein n=1 Tax=Borrelia persica TaxID=44448 RepID=UPI000467CE3B
VLRREEMDKILENAMLKLEKQGYDKSELKIRMSEISEKYKEKPHFIIENKKYPDLKKAIGKLKKTVPQVKDEEAEKKNLEINIFSILVDQFSRKVDRAILFPILREYLSKQETLDYKKTFNNHYYNEIFEIIEEKGYLKIRESEKIVT